MDLRRVGLAPDFWYPLARARDVATGATLRVEFAGDVIALHRTARGAVHALEDLPSGAAGVRAFPSREAYGQVFVFPGDPARAARVPLPDLPLWSSPRYRTLRFSREVRCHYSFLHENLMDMNDQFLHRGILGMIEPTLVGRDAGPSWVEARYRFQGGRDVLTVRTEYPYQRVRLARDGGEPSFELFSVYVPLGADQRRNRSVGLLTVRRPSVPGLLYLLWPFVRRFPEAGFAPPETRPVIVELRDLLARRGVPLAA
jgi:phenylpropionate dioxygenase-like ring-hydroxylating dioxygenase large terminal subunit